MRRVGGRRGGGPVALGVAVVTVAVLAWTSGGSATRHVVLNDGGVWVTDPAAGLIGELNVPIGQLEADLSPLPAAGDLDVLQSGSLVVDWQKGSPGRLALIDPARPLVTGPSVAVRTGDEVALGGSTLAVLDPGSGDLWGEVLAGAGGSLAGVASSAAPLARVAGGVAVAVGDDGTIFVAGPTSLTRIGVAGGGAGGFDRPASEGLSGPALVSTMAQPLSVTVVGDTPVVGSAAAGRVVFPDSGTSVAVPSGGAAAGGLVLQQVGPAAASVAVATSAGLYEIPVGADRLPAAEVPTGAGAAASPVRLGGCVYAAWGGSTPRYGRVCDGQPQLTVDQDVALSGSGPLVFRVNHDEVVLNDADGSIWLSSLKELYTTKLWSTAKPSPRHRRTSQRSHAHSQPPVANNDDLCAPAGEPTLLHVLDNDTDPDGDVLSVREVFVPAGGKVSAAISSDEQAVVATLAAGVTRATFSYDIFDGYLESVSKATVSVTAATSCSKQGIYQVAGSSPTPQVAPGGSVTFQVLGGWRDYGGYPLFLTNPAAESGSVTANSDGTLTYTALNRSSGPVTVRYTVSDGTRSASGSVVVKVLDTVEPAQTREDVVRAEVDLPVTVFPLANDLPGVDPRDPGAALQLAKQVTASGGSGLTVTTNLAAGSVTVTAQEQGSYVLNYKAAFGSAPVAAGTIRVDVVDPPAGADLPPVAEPDVVTVYGSAPAMVDVLANDYDPAGGVLDVQSAAPAGQGTGLSVAVVAGQALRITATRGPQPGGRAVVQSVNYQLTDGVGQATGTVTVRELPAGQEPPPVTHDDAIAIRAGTSATVAVLGNDVDPAGGVLNLAARALPVTPRSSGVLAGPAGSLVRVSAPVGAAATTATVLYTAQDSAGQSAPGYLHVTVIPAGQPGQAPTPQELTARVTAGGTVTIPVPEYGVDPTGDPVVLTDIPVAPGKGRITGLQNDVITYQAYPGSSGTDTFTYQVTDPDGGLTGTATVRVGIEPPQLLAPPVAVDDAAAVTPGLTVHVDVTANDIISAGDRTTVTLRTPPAGASVNGSVVTVTAPAAVGDPPVVVPYLLSDGNQPGSVATLTVTAESGSYLPLIARDDMSGPVTPTTKTVTVNVLANDSDPDGTAADLRISSVFGRHDVLVSGPDLTIPVTATAQEIPYQISAAGAGSLTAVAVVRVPGTGDLDPYLMPGAPIHLTGAHTSHTFQLRNYVKDPQGLPLTLSAASVTTSPAGTLTAVAAGTGAFTLDAAKTGPGAVSFTVSDGPRTITITIPVQVGRDVPVLVCSAQPVALLPGGAATILPVADVCTTWVDATINPASLTYTATAKAVAGVTASITGGTELTLRAASNATIGATGTVTVTVNGYPTATATFPVTVASPTSALATVTPVLLDATPKTPVRFSLTHYVTSPLARPQLTVVGAPVAADPAAGSISVQDLEVSIDLNGSATGPQQFTVTVTDEPGDTQREVTVPITVDLPGAPATPGAPVLIRATANSLTFTWAQPDNGSTPTGYNIQTGGRAGPCPQVDLQTPSCTLTGLTAGQSYSLAVQAVDGSHTSAFGPTATLTPNTPLGQVTDLTLTPHDGTITATWNPPTTAGGGAALSYTAQISADGLPGGPATTVISGHTFTGLTDGISYTITITPTTGTATGIPASKTATPVGPLGTVARPTAGPPTKNGSSYTMPVRWTPAPTNGNTLTTTPYTVTEYTSSSNSGPGMKVTTQPPTAALTTTFPVTAGPWYSYTVTTTDKTGNTTTSLGSIRIQAEPPVTAPETPTDLLASTPTDDRLIHLIFRPSATGSPATAYQYSISFAGSPLPGFQNVELNTSHTIGGLTTGKDYAVSIRACASSTVCSSYSAASTADPYGPPILIPNYTTELVNPCATECAGVNVVGSVEGDGRAIVAIDFPDAPFLVPTLTHQTVDTPQAMGESPVAFNNFYQGPEFGHNYLAPVQLTDSAGDVVRTSLNFAVPLPTLTLSEGGPDTGPGCESGCREFVINSAGWGLDANVIFRLSINCTTAVDEASCEEQDSAIVATDEFNGEVTFLGSGSFDGGPAFGSPGATLTISTGYNTETLKWQ